MRPELGRTVNRYAVRVKARGCPPGILPPRRTVNVRAASVEGAKRAAESLYHGWRAYAARLDRGPGGGV